MLLPTPAVLMFLLLGLWLGPVTDNGAAPDIVVVKNEWRKVVRNPALDDDPLRASRETAEFELEKIEIARANQVRRNLGREPLPPPTRISSGIKMGNPTVTYVYQAKIRNTGSRILRTVVWHYSFFDAEKQEEIGRTACTSKINLKPGKTADLWGTSRTPPIRVVDVTKAGKELKGTYTERVVITRIEYGDGTFWQRPVD